LLRIGQESVRADVPKLGNFILYFLFVAGAVVRAFADSLYANELVAAPYLLLSGFLAMSLAQPSISRRFPSLTELLVAVQSALILALLLTRPRHDYYAMLSMSLALVVAFELPMRRNIVWLAILCLVPKGGLVMAFGWPSGLTCIPSCLAGIIFIGLYGSVYRQMQASRQKNEKLLDEIQAANRRLKIYARKAEEASAAQERARLARELHDAVTQTAFSMNLTLEAARRNLEGDRSKLETLLDRVQALEGRASIESAPCAGTAVPVEVPFVGELANEAERSGAQIDSGSDR